MAPPINLPVPKNKKQANQQSAYKAYINAHPGLRRWGQAIWNEAINNGIDPVYFASLINTESGGDPNAHSGKNAWGLAQIHIPTWRGQPDPRDGHIITKAEINNPGWNLAFGAYLFGRSLRAHGYDYQAAYSGKGGYNKGGPRIFLDIPKGYVSTTRDQSPDAKAGRDVATARAKQALTDPFVTIKNGRLVKTNEKGAIHIFGQPLRRSELLETWQNLNDLYLSYTGKAVTLRAVKDILASGKSRYQIIDILARGPNFIDSPVWKQNAPGYQAVWKSIYGQDSFPDDEAIKYAIVNNLGADGFASTLRSRPDYETSAEFKSNESSLGGIYTKIYGVPDAAGKDVIKNAARQGQTSDMFAGYLRGQPEYQYSGEYKSRTLGLAEALGFVTGQVPTLSSGTGTGGSPVGSTPNPNPNAPPAGVLT